MVVNRPSRQLMLVLVAFVLASTQVCPAAAITRAGAARTGTAGAQAAPLLVVLDETGRNSGGLPVLRRHPHAEPVVRLLERGFSGRMLRLYRRQQELLRRASGHRPEPAYLLLSSRSGGFGRRGFVLDGTALPGTGYVDLPAGSERTAGRFGAFDQIFPHELLHVMVRDLAGDPRPSPSDVVHEVGTQTDRSYAFQEGFAEAMQILAVDDADAVPATQALRGAAGDRWRRRADGLLAGYRAALTARLPLAPPVRLSFPLWFGGVAATQRYLTVRRNGFARQPDLPGRLLHPGDPYAAYLLENVLPGEPQATPKPAARLVASEGVISYLMWRWLTDPTIRSHDAGDRVRSAFGLSGRDVDPADNAMLKLSLVLHERRPGDVVELVHAYRDAFPDDAGAVDRLVSDALVGQALPDAPELWMTNTRFVIGATVLDQYRSLRRPRTFDLNAASVVDLLAVPGTDRRAADDILAGAPYRSVDDLARVLGGRPRLLQGYRAMAAEHAARRRPPVDERESDVDLTVLARGYGVRALAYLLGVVACGTAVHRVIRRVRRRRAVAAGAVIGLLGLVPVWMAPGLAPPSAVLGLGLLLVPVALVGVPAVLLDAVRHHDARRARRTALAWLLSPLLVVLVTQTF